MSPRRLRFRSTPHWRPLRNPREATPRLGGIHVLKHVVSAKQVVQRGSRIVFFSDLHWEKLTAEGAEGLIELVNSQEADWLVFGGDLTRYLHSVKPAVEILASMHAARKKLAVPGNWELQHRWIDVGVWRRQFAKAGFELLQNESWPDDDLGIAFVGLDDARYGRPDFEAVEQCRGVDRLIVCLSHSPDAIGDHGDGFVGDIVLTGHTHGGQIRVPWFGALHTSSKYWKTFERGWSEHIPTGARMYVSAGIGCTGNLLFRRRIFCPPEVTVIEFGG